MKIDIILPYKEVFSSTKASAVSLTVKNSAEFSTYKKQISVYGQLTDSPFDNVKFIGIDSFFIIDSAIPPLAVPSILVNIIPVRGIFVLKDSTWDKAF